MRVSAPEHVPATIAQNLVRSQQKDHSARNDTTSTPIAGGSAPHVDIELHLGMDRAKYQKRSRLGKLDLHRLARLLGARIEIKTALVDPDIVSATVIVDNPHALSAPDREAPSPLTRR